VAGLVSHLHSADWGRRLVGEPVCPDEERRESMLGSLRSNNYRWLWLGNMATQAGLRMQDVALGWLVLELTDSSLYLGLTSFAQSLPLLLSPLGGILVDRWDRRRLLVTTQIVAAVLIVILATFVQTRRVRIWHVLTLVSLSGGVFALYFTTRQATIPRLVDSHNLLNAYSLDYAAAYVMRIAGPALAGVLVGTMGPGGCFYLQGLGYVLAFLSFLRIEQQLRGSTSPAGNVLADLAEQWRYAVRNRTILDLIVLSFVMIPFGMSYTVLMPVFARDILGVGPSGLGLLIGASGVGAIAVTLRLASGRGIRRRGLLLLIGSACLGMALILFATSRQFITSWILLVVIGGTGAVFSTMNSVLLQDVTPDELRGRVAGLYVLVWGLTPLGSLWMGAVAELVGAPLVLGLGGGICLAFSIAWAVARPSLRQLD
jgi:MFS family permease